MLQIYKIQESGKMNTKYKVDNCQKEKDARVRRTLTDLLPLAPIIWACVCVCVGCLKHHVYSVQQIKNITSRI